MRAGLFRLWHWWRDLSGFHRATLLLNLLGILAVVAYTRVASSQLNQTIISNRNAGRALRISERAYVTTEGPSLDQAAKFITLNISNDGHLPCMYSESIVHEATFNTTAVNAAPNIFDAVEFHWKRHISPLPPGKNVSTVLVPVPEFSEEKFSAEGAHQSMVITGQITYDDGFAEDGLQRWEFCFSSVYQLTLRKIFWVPCNSAIYLPTLEVLDGYPKNEQQ